MARDMSSRTVTLFKYVGAGLSIVAFVSLAAWASERPGAPRSPGGKEASADSVPQPSEQDAVEMELSTIPDGDQFELTQESHPEMFQAIHAQLGGVFPGHQPPASPLESRHLIRTRGGLLAVFELGDGIVRLQGTAVDFDNPDLDRAAMRPAFTAEVTEFGIEVTSMDVDALIRFTGADSAGVTREAGGELPTTEATVGPCENHAGTTCCFVTTEQEACICCFRLAPPIQPPMCQCNPF